MHLKKLEIHGFKSFAKKSEFIFTAPISAIVGPNGSGKSNVVEGLRFVLGEQSLKSLRGKKGADLIFNGSKTVSRGSKARVGITFDNSKREFDIDFDSVEIAREVGNDGSNSYFINGSQVRLRDVFEILAGVNIGASGHHIISQGEADRILNASPKDRKVMIEDALGLKIYQWKIGESTKKLEKTQLNIKEAESLRREIAPHIKFLGKQVEKIEQANAQRRELGDLYNEYLKRESIYLKAQKEKLNKEKAGPEAELKEIEHTLAALESELATDNSRETSEKEARILEIQKTLRTIRSEKDELSRKIGKIEGLVEYKSVQEKESEEDVVVSGAEVDGFAGGLEKILKGADASENIGELRKVINEARAFIGNFTMRIFSSKRGGAQNNNIHEELASLRNEIAGLQEKAEKKTAEEDALITEEQTLKKDIESQKENSRESERELYEARARKTEVASTLQQLETKKEELTRDSRDFEEELKEGAVLVGEKIRAYEAFNIGESEVMSEERTAQERRRKAIERIKIRLEDIGGGSNEETLKEYEEAVARDEFLEKEITDLKETAESLKDLIEELSEKIAVEFKEGIKKINTQFSEFFALMFGGGTASLGVVAEIKRRRRSVLEEELEGEIPDEEETEEGVEVKVNLPHKKIKGLMMLSGGERALTSIALLFAVSQVNPPPFLVLDETDAALDEANSKKYGDMLDNLSKHSQLIVVTHNRETMSRAGILYGVTMGADAVSELLSVKFDEATEFAK